MRLWRRTRGEVAGAWRSLRYDIDKHAEREVPHTPLTAAQTDVTCTGMSTFGGAAAGELSIGYTADLPRRPRRMVAVSAFGVLAVAGAAGSYFAVVNGLGSVLGDSVLGEKPASAEAHPYPLSAAEPTTASTAGLGHGSMRRPRHLAAPLAATGRATAAPTAAALARGAATAPHRTAYGRTAAPGDPRCDCLTPPVPTPTAPAESPSATPSPAPPLTPMGTASPSRSVSASSTPSDTLGSEAFGRKRHAGGY
jgi:hypothetical protein